MKITIESPWDNGTYEGILGMFVHYIKQLEYFRKQKEQDDDGRAAIDADIRGYQQILDSKSEQNADTFLKIKALGHTGKMKPFRTNEDVVKHMKENGLWVEAE